MSWIRIEVEYICPLCNESHISYRRELISSIGVDVSKCMSIKHCPRCNTCFGIAEWMEIARLSIPVKDDLGISIF